MEWLIKGFYGKFQQIGKELLKLHAKGNTQFV